MRTTANWQGGKNMKVENFERKVRNEMAKIYKKPFEVVWDDMKKCIETLPEDLEVKNYESIVINYETGKAYNCAHYYLDLWLEKRYDEYQYYLDANLLEKLNFAKTIVALQWAYTVVGAYLVLAEKTRVYVKLTSREGDPDWIKSQDLYLKLFTGYNGIVTNQIEEDITVLEFDISFFEN